MLCLCLVVRRSTYSFSQYSRYHSVNLPFNIAVEIIFWAHYFKWTIEYCKKEQLGNDQEKAQ